METAQIDHLQNTPAFIYQGREALTSSNCDIGKFGCYHTRPPHNAKLHQYRGRCALLKMIMLDDYKKSKYFNYLLKNFKEIDKERIEFNKEVLTLLNRQTDELGTILKCHLIIEYYIDSYLKSAYPTILNWESSRLTFNQKLELINNNRTPIGMYYPSIKCLNSLRNKFSHRISYVVEKRDYKEIEDIMTIWKNALNEL